MSTYEQTIESTAYRTPIESLSAAFRRAVTASLQWRRDRKEARKIEKALRAMDRHLLTDIGFYEIKRKVEANPELMPRSVVKAVKAFI